MAVNAEVAAYLDRKAERMAAAAIKADPVRFAISIEDALRQTSLYQTALDTEAARIGTQLKTERDKHQDVL